MSEYSREIADAIYDRLGDIGYPIAAAEDHRDSLIDFMTEVIDDVVMKHADPGPSNPPPGVVTKHIDIEEFCELGFLQEANRQFFHPHGLALEVTADGGDEARPYKNAVLSGVWDYREDPEGIIGVFTYDKGLNVLFERAQHIGARIEMFETDPEINPFADIQPLDWVVSIEEDSDGS